MSEERVPYPTTVPDLTGKLTEMADRMSQPALYKALDDARSDAEVLRAEVARLTGSLVGMEQELRSQRLIARCAAGRANVARSMLRLVRLMATGEKFPADWGRRVVELCDRGLVDVAVAGSTGKEDLA